MSLLGWTANPCWQLPGTGVSWKPLSVFRGFVSFSFYTLYAYFHQEIKTWIKIIYNVLRVSVVNLSIGHSQDAVHLASILNKLLLQLFFYFFTSQKSKSAFFSSSCLCCILVYTKEIVKHMVCNLKVCEQMNCLRGNSSSKRTLR